MSHVRRIDPPRPDWRTTKAEALEAAAMIFDRGLEQLAECERLLEDEGDELSCRSLRASAAFLRTARNERLDKATRLRDSARGAAAEATAEAGG